MSEFADDSLDVAIPDTTPTQAWQAARALAAAKKATKKRLPEILAIAGLELDEIRAGREEARQ